MKRIVLYIGILAAVLAVPVKRLDVGELLPVQAVSVQRENGQIVIRTDTGDRGTGDTAAQALQNLRDTAAGIVYLDTAEFLLLGENTAQAAEELRQELKPSVRLCMAAEQVNLQKAVEYLHVHGSLPCLKEWEAGNALPVLTIFEGSLKFIEKG